MRTNNLKVKTVIISVYFIMIVFAILAATVFSVFSDLTKNPLLIFGVISFSFAVLFYSVHKVSKYFEYDSDGAKVVITNKGLLLSEYLNYREHTIEFEKRELSGFKFNDYIIFKTLVLHLKTKHGNNKKERFNVTLVAKKKRRYIKQSLSKIVKHNIKEKEKKQINS